MDTDISDTLLFLAGIEDKILTSATYRVFKLTKPENNFSGRVESLFSRRCLNIVETEKMQVEYPSVILNCLDIHHVSI